MQKRRNTLRFIGRILIIWAIEVLGLLFMVWLLPGVRVDSLLTAIMAVAAIGVLNALLWPLLSYLMLPFAVLTLGLFSLVLNGVLVLLATVFVEGFEVATLWDGIAVTLGLTAINAIMSSLLTIDDDNSFHRNAVRRRIQRRTKPVETDVPGVLFLELDGLAKPVLERAMSEGYMPTLAQWLESGSHRLSAGRPISLHRRRQARLASCSVRTRISRPFAGGIGLASSLCLPAVPRR